MSISYNQAWNDTRDLVRAHGSLVATVAGVFIFLPGLLVAYFLPQPHTDDIRQILPLISEYFSRNWPWLLLTYVLTMIGSIVILLLVFARDISVGGAIAASLAILPFYFLASLLTGLILAPGFLLLVVPGLYLLGRLGPLGQVVVAENRRNPVDAIMRCLALTRGNGWAILGLILLVAVAAIVAIVVAVIIVGILLVLLAGRDAAELPVLILQTAGNTALRTLMLLLGAAIYRQLAGRDLGATFE
ncbi:MAG: hypothetical protein ACJ8ER_05410 [Allosphingosinicella sp.]